MVTGRGMNIPVDASSICETALEFDKDTGLPLFRYGEHISHFDTCLDSRRWRRLD
jgi:hypothetical protein